MLWEGAARTRGRVRALRDGAPVLIDVVRSGVVESVHRASVVVLDPSGQVTAAAGDVDRPIYPRSASKPLQATALAACLPGALSARELAIAAGSHSGEPEHIETVHSVLRSGSLSVSDLACPPDFPLDAAAARRVVESGQPADRLMMNCSGKHAAMLLTSVRAGWPSLGYSEVDHPVQRAVRATIETLAGETVSAVGVDGCGAPLFALPLRALARAVASLAHVENDSPGYEVARAMRAYPFLVAGTDRLDTVAIRAIPGLVSKTGWEGVHVATLEDGTAFAVKVHDGQARAAEVVFLAMLRTLGAPSTQVDKVQGSVRSEIYGGAQVVGRVQVRRGTLP